MKIKRILNIGEAIFMVAWVLALIEIINKIIINSSGFSPFEYSVIGLLIFITINSTLTRLEKTFLKW